MMGSLRHRVTCRWAGALLLLAASPVRAGEVTLQLNNSDAQVGVPITAQLTLSNVENHEPPQFPPLPDAEVRASGVPNTSRSVQVINGRMTQSLTITYVYQIVPRKPGTLRIPPIRVVADGKTFETEPQIIGVTRGEGTGNLLFVELKTDRSECYVGEHLQAVLEIWIAPFTDRRYDVQFDQRDMWNCVDRQNSSWGMFAALLDQRGGITWRRDQRMDDEGRKHSYIVYQLAADLWPEKAGPLDAGDIRVLVQYPTRVGRDPTPFGFFERGLRVTDARPLLGEVRPAPVRIKPIPREGRPAWFRGAVGAHTIRATARPTEVSVGDPITLTIEIAGGGRLELLQPPPLNEIQPLARDFKIPTDPLAGTVESGVKRFVQSIRATREEIKEIPSIPFAWFDPTSERFVTVYSDPIPIVVRPVNQLALSQVVESAGGPRRATELTESATGIVANYTEIDALLAQQAVTLGGPAAAGLIAPPILYGFCWIVQRRRLRLRHDVAFARRSSAARRARENLRNLNGHDTESARSAAAVLRGYVADRLNLPSGLTNPETLEQLRRHGVAADTSAGVRELLDAAEALQYAGGGAMGAGRTPPAELAAQCIDRLERERL